MFGRELNSTRDASKKLCQLTVPMRDRTPGWCFFLRNLVKHHLQGGRLLPLLVINGVITLLIGVISPFITGRGRKFRPKTKKSRVNRAPFM